VNRGELREELYALGHRYLEQETGRADRFINQAGRDIVLDEPWPQRVVAEPLATGAALVSLGTVLQVWDTTTGRVLQPTTAQTIRDAFTASPLTAGEPVDYWVVQNRTILTRPALPAGRTVTVEHYSKGGVGERRRPQA
jgi:hypothetical protein